MTKEDKRKIFEPLKKNFETEEFGDYYMDMVAEIPTYIFSMPSSTSGKYHNAKQCQTYGQIYHIYMFDSILNHRLRLKINKELYPTPEERDRSEEHTSELQSRFDLVCGLLLEYK